MKSSFKYVPICEDELRNTNNLHISIVAGYISNLSTTWDFPELPSAELLPTPSTYSWEPHRVASFKQHLKQMFVVPRLHQTKNRIHKFHLVEAFLSLLQLLYNKTDPIVDRFEDGIENLEKELRFLLTILGDISWLLCHTNHLQPPDFQNLLPEFEALANQAGSFVHYLFFSDDQATFEETDERLAALLKHTDLLKANLQSFVSIPAASAYITPTPTTSIVDSILILDSLVDDLEDLLKREDDPIADVKDQVNLLHHELMLSHSSIKDMRSPQPSEIEQLKEPLMHIGGIAHQAQYLITAFLVKDAPLWYIFNRLTHLSHMIAPIRMELQLITQKYKLGRLEVAEYFSAKLALHYKRNTEVNEVTVGLEDKTTYILDQLVGGPGTESLQIISIIGMPGLGKTTLANKLYNHPFVSYRFDKLAWCVVSQTYNRHSVLANILIHINSELNKDSILNMDEISLVQQIHQTLMGRRYLIVLDDIWDSSVSDELLRCFQDDGNGSRILVTSRNKDVAPPNSIMHELPLLSDEQCWELLEKKLFGSRTCPTGLQGIGKKIASRCFGLPLTVVVIAGVLSTMDGEESAWEEVRGSLGSYINGEDNSVMRILELSYKHLPDHLKPCFLYFGEFEEDEEISVGNLKRLWVAEGFIRREKDKSVENVAGEYLMELIDKSLVMIVKRRKDGGGAKRCIVHDLLRDLCLKLSKEECFLKYMNKDYPHIVYEKGHRVQVYGDTGTLSNRQHVSSLVGDYVLGSFFVRDMRLLRVLYFKGIYSLKNLGIEYLVNLRFFVFPCLPTWIDKLENLEYVRVEMLPMGHVVYLPPTIMKMKKLRYLCAEKAEYSEDCNSNQTNNLEYLSRVVIKKLKDEELLKCSPHLRKLKCSYDVLRRTDESAYPHFDFRFLTQLDSLLLSGYLGKGDLVFPSNIRKLTLLRSRLLWEKMSIVGRLEFLEVLKLGRDAFEGERWDTRDGEFQKLRFLLLENSSLSEWNVEATEHFPKLEQLILIGCQNLKEIPSEIGEITALEMIEVAGVHLSSLVESAERIKEEQRDMGNEDLRVSIRDDPGFPQLFADFDDFADDIAQLISEIGETTTPELIHD